VVAHREEQFGVVVAAGRELPVHGRAVPSACRHAVVVQVDPGHGAHCSASRRPPRARVRRAGSSSVWWPVGLIRPHPVVGRPHPSGGTQRDTGWFPRGDHRHRPAPSNSRTRSATNDFAPARRKGDV
jgi:hypothetical protein